MGPSLLIFSTVMVLPFLFGILLSFTDWNGLSATFSFIGFGNYSEVFHDKVFWSSFVLTLKYVLCTVTLTNIIAFSLAYLLTGNLRGRNFLKAGFFTPNLIGGIILGFVWQFVFSRVLTTMGKSLGWSLFATSWLSDPDKAFWAMVIVTVWQYSGYMMVIYIAGLMSIPKELIEAAEIEGASSFTRVRKIVLPFLVPSIIVCVFLTVQRGFMVYDINLALTSGGPFRSTALISMNVYQTAFLSQRYGPGQAEAFFLFLVVAAISLTQVYLGKKQEIEL